MQPKDQNIHFTSKVRTFLGSKDIILVLTSLKALAKIEEYVWHLNLDCFGLGPVSRCDPAGVWLTIYIYIWPSGVCVFKCEFNSREHTDSNTNHNSVLFILA